MRRNSFELITFESRMSQTIIFQDCLLLSRYLIVNMKTCIFLSLVCMLCSQLIVTTSRKATHDEQDDHVSSDERNSNLNKVELLPCPGCKYHLDPICAVSTQTGKHRTFDNECIMSAEDCGKSERRKLLNLEIC